MQELNRKTASSPQGRPIRVLQFGEGNFLRAFADWMIDVANERINFNTAVQIVQPLEQGAAELLNRQQGLYHVILNGIADQKPVRETRLISCVDSVLNPYHDYKAYLKLGENPGLKFILSNTTESGIAFNENDESPDVLPKSFPGKLTALLFQRFKHFNGSSESGVILLPCELVEKNASLLKTVILQYFEKWKLGEPFKLWLEKYCTFCNTLVDRIVPGFPKDTIGEIQSATGFEDRLAVMAEPFHLWVIEAPTAVQKAFPLDKAGLQVKFVDDLTPYRTRKVRILNGAHTAMVPPALLQGLQTVRETIEDPTMGAFVSKMLSEEIIPTLDMSAEELHEFSTSVIERFKNPFIKHELSSIALNSISKFKVRVLPSILGYIRIKNKFPDLLLTSFAALILFYRGQWQGRDLPVNDDPIIQKFFQETWKENDPEKVAAKVLGNPSLWGQDLTQVKGLTEEVAARLRKLTSSLL